MDETGTRPDEVRAVGGQAGAMAAIVMLIMQLLWRLDWSATAVPAFPEIVVTAIARLTPLDLFATITESVGSVAKNTLFVAVLIGIIGVGSSTGMLIERRMHRRQPPNAFVAFSLALVAAAMFWLVAAVLVFPLAHLGIFALDSRNTEPILTQTAVTFAVFGVLLGTLLARARRVNAIIRSQPTAIASRRRAMAGGFWILAGVAWLARITWRLLNPATVATASGPTTAELVDRQQQLNAGVQASPPPSPSPSPRATPAVASQTVDFAGLESTRELTPLLTPISTFYKVSKNIADPQVPAEKWSLSVGGLVAKELTFTYEQLRQRPTVRKITTLCCISNELNGDLIGTGEWTGFPLRDLLDEAGVDLSKTVDIRLFCADDYEDSFPLAVALDPDTLVVTELNGLPLNADHGFPCRLIVPNIYGMKNVKWLERIEAVDKDFLGFWETRGWSDEAICQIWGRIDVPRASDEVAAGQAIAAGLAAAGHRGIYRVEVSLDDGASWAAATLEPPLNEPFTWVRWAFPFEAAPGEQTLTIRAIDGEGAVMDEQRRPPLPDGATGWPTRTFTVV